MIATAPADILHFIAAREREGVATSLVTLADVIGSSPRAIGAQMAVAADGRYVGSFSGGCIEAAVVAEAMAAIAAGEARSVRFGAGSPYIDIRLPCGGGIDLLFNPNPEADAIACALACLARREPVTLSLSGAVRAVDATMTGWHGDAFLTSYLPPLRILAIGQGEDLAATARLARYYGAEATILSPDRGVVEELAREGADALHIAAPTPLPPIMSDPWTAIVFLFHDRDWEERLLPHALALPAFYVGAMGSRRTHDRRLEALRAAKVPAGARERLRGPVGSIPATRDPATLALSILAEIVQEYRAIADVPAVMDAGDIVALSQVG